ncbi:Bardet-Biedl syndrome 4 protein [Schistosoma japonicum]|nr:Bardet-Biedl syndrome 4 protein [Schistosoma japonicum]KAH8875408.1 Bardet-Biedl syndrome 4 protein [Schistosoma japonicum]KAH8875409.1 Bardet-Biedl syndrome 4 protein [Schistosoma japonicum]
MHKEFLYIQPVESVNWLLHTLYTQSAFGKCTDIIKNCAEQFSLNDIDYHLYCLSLIHRLDGCTGQSLSHLYKCLEHNNKSADILKQIAKSLQLRGHHNEALKIYEDLLTHDQNDWETLYGQGICYFYTKQYELAECCFRNSSKITKNIKPLKWLAKVQLTKNSINSAIKTLKKATLLVPEDPDLFYNLGSLYFQTNQDQLAFECLSSTILLKPDHFDANQLAGVIMTLHGDYDVALNKYRSIVKQSSENSILWNNIGVALMGKRNLIASITCFKRAIYLTPFNWRIASNLGIVHMQTSQWLSAVQYLTTSINLIKQKSFHYSMNDYNNQKTIHDIGMLYCLLGYCHIKLNEYSKAYEAFMNAYKQSSKNPLVILNCASFLVKSNKRLAHQLFTKYEKLLSTTNELTLPYWVNKHDILFPEVN